MPPPPTSAHCARRHPNVVRIYGYCLEPPTVCLIMELLPAHLSALLPHTSRKARPGAAARGPSHLAPGVPGALGPSQGGGNHSLRALLGLGPQDGQGGGNATNAVLGPTNGPGTRPGSGSSGPAGGPLGAEGGTAAAAPSQQQRPKGPPASSGGRPGSAGGPAAGDLPPSAGPAPLTMAKVVRLAADIAAGLAHLHAKDKAASIAGTDLGVDDDEEALRGEAPSPGRVVHRGAPGGGARHLRCTALALTCACLRPWLRCRCRPQAQQRADQLAGRGQDLGLWHRAQLRAHGHDHHRCGP